MVYTIFLTLVKYKARQLFYLWRKSKMSGFNIPMQTQPLHAEKIGNQASVFELVDFPFIFPIINCHATHPEKIGQLITDPTQFQPFRS